MNLHKSILLLCKREMIEDPNFAAARESVDVGINLQHFQRSERELDILCLLRDNHATT